MKLGKLPARKDSVKFKLADYVNLAALPAPPPTFGHEKLIDPKSWQMLGNDQYGDCVWAGAAHETRLWNLEAGLGVDFTDQAVLSDYAKATGFNPNNPASDKGTDMQAAASYRRTTGIVDARANRHKIAAYLALKPGDLTELYAALYLFGAVGIGIQFPRSAMAQFKAGRPWSVVKSSPVIGGHYIPLVAKRSHLECVSWGQIQQMSLAFLERYNDESIAYVSLETLTNNKSPEGFNAAQLQADLNQL